MITWSILAKRDDMAERPAEPLTPIEYAAYHEAEREYQNVEQDMKITGRRCGSCSLCCRLLDVPQAGKLPQQWCPHCKPGKGGCNISETRPAPCRDWECLWLTKLEFGDEWRPQRCGMVVSSNFNEDGSVVVRIHVDPGTPNVWRKESYLAQIKTMARRGLTGRATKPFKTFIVIGNRYLEVTWEATLGAADRWAADKQEKRT